MEITEKYTRTRGKTKTNILLVGLKHGRRISGNLGVFGPKLSTPTSLSRCIYLSLPPPSLCPSLSLLPFPPSLSPSPSLPVSPSLSPLSLPPLLLFPSHEPQCLRKQRTDSTVDASCLRIYITSSRKPEKPSAFPHTHPHHPPAQYLTQNIFISVDGTLTP